MVPIAERFVQTGRKIVGIGFNYKCLVRQMNLALTEKPKFFLKATSSYITEGQKIRVPEWSKEGIWYEVELGVVIKYPIKRATPKNVMDYVGGYCTAIDLTDKNSLLNDRQLGWSISKSFDGACAVGSFIHKSKVPNVDDVHFWLDMNGVRKQEGHTRDMTWDIPKILSFVSHFMTLEPGDMVLTGTPGGVDMCQPGDTIEAGIKGVDSIRFEVAAESTSTQDPFEHVGNYYE